MDLVGVICLQKEITPTDIILGTLLFPFKRNDAQIVLSIYVVWRYSLALLLKNFPRCNKIKIKVLNGMNQKFIEESAAGENLELKIAQFLIPSFRYETNF